MRRTFELDVLACPGCGGRLRLLATINDRAVVKKILAHLGLATELPRGASGLVDGLPFAFQTLDA
jgi:hypothetical protein